MVSKLTYGQLQKALEALGFIRKPHEHYFVLENDAHDALLAFAGGDDDTPVRPAYRLSVTSTVVGMGVATEAELRRALDHVRGNRRRVAPRRARTTRTKVAEVA